MIAENYKIEISSLKKQFGELVVLRDINLKIAPGAVIALIGPSGSGEVHTAPLHEPAGHPGRRPYPHR